MRLVGLAGLPAILAIAFLFSTNRKAVKPRTVFWGIGLQVLFGAIILGKDLLSWIGLFILAALILLYAFEERITGTNRSLLLLPTLILITAMILGTALTYALSSIGLAYGMFWLLLFSHLPIQLFKKGSYHRYVFAAWLLLGLGILFQNGYTGQDLMRIFSAQVSAFLSLSDLGAEFLFGNLARKEHFDLFGYQFAFSVLPTIIFFSAVMSILYYLGIMQACVKAMARFMRWTMGTSGSETLSCSANIFVGQTEAPLLIKPFLSGMTLSELHAIMVGGFATIAGGVLAGYIRMGVDAGHLIAASVMSAPAALVLAKIFYPETQHSQTAGDVEIPTVKKAENLLDATAQGVTDGLKLAVNVGAMLLAFIALIGLVDVLLGFFDRLIDGRLLGGEWNALRGEFAGFFPGSLKTFFGTLFAPLAFLMGVPWHESMQVGNLLGIKIAANEFVAYGELSQHIHAADLSNRAQIIATYALCGFANFSSIGIQIGGISALAPERRSDLSKIALRAMFAGALASWMTATIAGIIL
ncbi:NupC/NupG family nucleoside CNT transporter [candidate division KSB1 bacterium]|nr:NupC/NupG family nucleoside CNT transporter [candidate division KSB1 bacterium]